MRQTLGLRDFAELHLDRVWEDDWPDDATAFYDAIDDLVADLDGTCADWTVKYREQRQNAAVLAAGAEGGTA